MPPLIPGHLAGSLLHQYSSQAANCDVRGRAGRQSREGGTLESHALQRQAVGVPALQERCLQEAPAASEGSAPSRHSQARCPRINSQPSPPQEQEGTVANRHTFTTPTSPQYNAP